MAIRPGDLLAGRYRLDDLLSESRGARFWRAYDRVLARPVSVHVIDAEDHRAGLLQDAARKSARVTDRRFLRVLDSNVVDGVCFVVNEWGQGRSLDLIVSSSGPLDPRSAAWLCAETAAAITSAHIAGVTHGRMVPENVLVDGAGSVRVIGLAVDAALHGQAPAPPETDVADLGGVVYAAVTGRWAGPSQSAMPPAPREGGLTLRPRQVRAGVPRALDGLCSEILRLSPVAGTHIRLPHDLTTARGVTEALREYVGSPVDLTDLQAGTPLQPTVTDPTPRTPDPAEPPALDAEPEPDPDTEPDQPMTEPMAPVDLPTQAGMPIFEENGEVDWLVARAGAPPPPPRFEDAPPRPLFAPDPAEGAPRRTPRNPSAVSDQTTSATDQWAGDSGSADRLAQTATGTLEHVPGRRSLRIALLIGLVGALLLAALVVRAMLQGPAADPPSSQPSGTSSSSSTPSPTPLPGLSAIDFDPQGDAGEHPDTVALAVDGDPGTSWRTWTYKQQFGPGGLKSGLGLVVDLGESRVPRSVAVTVAGSPTTVAVFLSEDVPTDSPSGDPLASDTGGGKLTLTLEGNLSGRYLTVWLTGLPKVRGGFRGEISEVVVSA